MNSLYPSESQFPHLEKGLVKSSSVKVPDVVVGTDGLSENGSF